jgi:type IV pilus assembly protein PilB
MAKPDMTPKGVIDSAIGMRASDVLFEPLSDHSRIRFRLDGVVEDYAEIPKDKHGEFIEYLEKTAGMKPMVDGITHDDIGMKEGHFETDYRGRNVMLRATLFPAIRGQMAAVRILDPANLVTLEQLGLHGYQLEKYKDIIGKNGLVLVTGPTGAGKTTTVYATLKYLDPGKKNIFTMEDPVEYPVDGLNQINVDRTNPDQSFRSFFSGMLRAAPDVIYAGEVRDYEVAHTVFDAADIGHLIFATTHSDDSERVMGRMIGMGVEHGKINSLSGIVSQRLVRELCGGCKMEYAPDDVVHKKEREILGAFGIGRAYRENPEGCGECNYKGFKGRKGAFEVLDTRSDKMKETFIQSGSLSPGEMRKQAINDGQELDENLGQTALELVRNGTTSINEIYRMFPGYNLMRGTAYRAR